MRPHSSNRSTSSSKTAIKNRMPPIHPGEILLEEYLKPWAMSANAFARVLHVPPNRVSAIIACKRAITADTALRLARALGTSAELWMNLQQIYDLRIAELDKKSGRAAVRPIKTNAA
jgi:addiction module HigA family antidote